MSCPIRVVCTSLPLPASSTQNDGSVRSASRSAEPGFISVLVRSAVALIAATTRPTVTRRSTRARRGIRLSHRLSRLSAGSIAIRTTRLPNTDDRVLEAAELDARGPHQMRHTFASLLLQEGVPITYVSRQLGHKDAS